jgi:hypothetical protein
MERKLKFKNCRVQDADACLVPRLELELEAIAPLLTTEGRFFLTRDCLEVMSAVRSPSEDWRRFRGGFEAAGTEEKNEHHTIDLKESHSGRKIHENL